MKKIPTIEQLHKKKLEYFNSLQKSLPSKLLKLNNLKKGIDENTIDISDKLEVLSEIETLTSEIKNIKDKTEENDYLLRTCSIFYEYDKTKNEDKVSENIDDSGIITQHLNYNKQKYVQEYLKAIGEFGLLSQEYLNLSIEYKCKSCNSYNLIEELSYLHCGDCGILFGREISNSNLSYKEIQEVDYVSHYYYKRINHFKECLNQLQAKENTTIPEEVIQSVIDEIKKEKIPLDKLTTKKIQLFLKKNKFTKYTENTHTIQHRITGKRIELSNALEERLEKMFNDIQKPFEKYKGNRKNFLSYNYCFYKFFELLDLHEYLQYFPLLKDRNKLSEHDVIWKKICLDMKWDFTPCR